MLTSAQSMNRHARRAIADLMRTAVLAAILLTSVSVLLVALLATAPTARAASASLDIKVPTPVSGVASGPVGANVSISGVGTAGHTYQIGYALKSAGCASGVQNLSNETATAKQDGTFADTFTWPTSGTTRGDNYYICAQDQSLVLGTLAAPIQSTQVFKPLTSDGEQPNIVVQATPSVVPPGATPQPTPPDNTYYAASQITIAGSNFVPGHSTLTAFVTAAPTFSAADAHNFAPMVLDNGATSFTSQSNGVFQVTVTLPPRPTGLVYVHVVSTDYTSAFPPSLDASQQITLKGPLPTATPSTPTPATTASPSATNHQGQGNGGGNNQPTDPSSVLAVIGLSGLSVILFVIGIILMTSASALPRGQR